MSIVSIIFFSQNYPFFNYSPTFDADPNEVISKYHLVLFERENAIFELEYELYKITS